MASLRAPARLVLAAFLATVGCYRSHERPDDAGVWLDSARSVPDVHIASIDAGHDAPDASCPPETCDGHDDDCDGVVDEGSCEAFALHVAVGGGDIRNVGCVATRDARVACWGWNGEGIVDPGGPPAAITRARWVAHIESAREVQVGRYVACARTDIDVRCWGTHVGSPGGAVEAPSPIPALAGATAMTVTSSGFCGLLADGTVDCGGSVPPRLGSVGPVPYVHDAIAIAASSWNEFVVDRGGALRGSGLNYAGELGDGTIAHRSDTLVSIGVDAPVVEVCTGMEVSCARYDDGGVACWGTGGSVGDGTTEARPTPVRLAFTDVVDVACGDGYACVVTADGAAWCWGYNGAGELGDGTRESRASPVRVPLDDVVDIAAGTTTTCAVRGDGSVWCWGDNHMGAVGDGTTEGDLTDGWAWVRLRPTRVAMP